MNPLILIIGIVAVPTLLITIFRVKAAMVFMALCVGSVLSNFVGGASMDMVQTLMRGYNSSTQSTVQLGLLLTPVVLTLLFLNRTIAGSKWLINIFPALLTGIVTLFLVVPMLPPGTQQGIYDNSIWNQLTQYQPALIGGAVLITLGQLWAGGHGAKHKKDKHKK